MHFQTLRIRNFLSFGETQEFNLQNRGIVSVFGVNGQGKSSVVEAIIWCLWGKTIRGFSGDDVVNNQTNKDCLVFLSLSDGDTGYGIIRTRKAKGKKPNDLQILVNGEEVSQGINKDTQAEVDKIIGFSFDTFQASIMLSHGNVSFCDMTDSQKKEILEDILQTSKISYAKNVALTRYNTKKTEIEILERDFSSLNTSITREEHRLTGFAIELEKQKLNVLKKKVDVVENRVKIETQLEELYDELLTEEIFIDLTSFQISINEIDKQLEQLRQKEISEYKDQSNENSELISQKVVLQEKINSITKQYQKVSAVKEAECPTCLQVVDKEHLKECISQWLAGIKVLKSSLLDVEGQITEVKAKYGEKANEGILARADLISKKNIQLQEMQKVTALVTKRNNCISRIKNLEEQRNNLSIYRNQETDYLFKCYSETSSEIKKLERLLKENRSKAEDLSKELSALEFWKVGFGNQGLKSLLLDNVLLYLTERAQYYADLLTDGQVEITFDNKKQLKSKEWKEELQIQINNRSGSSKYLGNSSGERRRVDIAVAWALGDLAAKRVNKSLKFKSLDEPFENLDEQGIEAVIKLLNKVVNDYETIIVISHNEALRNRLPHEILIQKENGFSKIIDC